MLRIKASMIWFSISVLKHDSQWGRSTMWYAYNVCMYVRAYGRTYTCDVAMSKAENKCVICHRKTTSFSCCVDNSEWRISD